MSEAGVGREERRLPNKERLSDNQLGNLISAVGNNEAKALTLLSMENHRVYPRLDIFRELIKKQGDRIGWKTSPSTPFKYCQDSLSPIGLVTKEEIDRDLHIYGYGITESGETQGKILSGLLLDYSEKHPELSLSEIFGATFSSSRPHLRDNSEGDLEFKKRSPSTRLKIFRELITRELPISLKDLAEALGESKTIIDDHIFQLKRFNIISYESSGVDNPYAFFELSSKRPNQEPKQYESEPTLTDQIYSFFLNQDAQKPITIDEITDHFFKNNPGKIQLDKKNFKQRINNILQHLKKGQYLTQGKFGVSIRSEITLSDTQKATLQDLVTLIDKFQRQDPEILEEGRRRAIEIINNPERVANLMKKAKEHSPNANKLAIEERAQHILSMIQEHPNLTNADLFNLQNEPPKLSKSRLMVLTRYLETIGKVVSSREEGKKQKRFTAVDSVA